MSDIEDIYQEYVRLLGMYCQSLAVNQGLSDDQRFRLRGLALKGAQNVLKIVIGKEVRIEDLKEMCDREITVN